MGRPFKCPYCEASDNVSKGVRRTKTMGDRRIFRCRKCGRKFTPKHQQAADVGPAGNESTGQEAPAAKTPDTAHGVV